LGSLTGNLQGLSIANINRPLPQLHSLHPFCRPRPSLEEEPALAAYLMLHCCKNDVIPVHPDFSLNPTMDGEGSISTGVTCALLWAYIIRVSLLQLSTSDIKTWSALVQVVKLPDSCYLNHLLLAGHWASRLIESDMHCCSRYLMFHDTLSLFRFAP